MGDGFLDPWTTYLRFDESSTMRTHRYADRVSAVRVETTGTLPDAVRIRREHRRAKAD